MSDYLEISQDSKSNIVLFNNTILSVMHDNNTSIASQVLHTDIA